MLSTVTIIALSSIAKAATTITQEFVIDDTVSPLTQTTGQTFDAVVTGVNTNYGNGPHANATHPMLTIQTSPHHNATAIGTHHNGTRTGTGNGAGTGAIVGGPGAGTVTTETDTMPGTETDTRLTSTPTAGANGTTNGTNGGANATATATGGGSSNYEASVMAGILVAGAVCLLL